MPRFYKEYDLRRVFDRRWSGIGKYVTNNIFKKKPRVGADATFVPKDLARALEKLDVMPDGLMPCIAPFTTMQMNGPEHANFCCYSTSEYVNIPVDATGGLNDAWNAPKFVEARQHFIDGNYDKVCRPHCVLYRKYLDAAKAKAEGRSFTVKAEQDATNFDSEELLRGG